MTAAAVLTAGVAIETAGAVTETAGAAIETAGVAIETAGAATEAAGKVVHAVSPAAGATVSATAVSLLGTGFSTCDEVAVLSSLTAISTETGGVNCSSGAAHGVQLDTADSTGCATVTAGFTDVGEGIEIGG